jgi:hypothetical protein
MDMLTNQIINFVPSLLWYSIAHIHLFLKVRVISIDFVVSFTTRVNMDYCVAGPFWSSTRLPAS